MILLPRRIAKAQQRDRVTRTQVIVLKNTNKNKIAENTKTLQRKDLQIFRWEYLNPRLDFWTYDHGILAIMLYIGNSGYRQVAIETQLKTI
jgi:hypothetical protein